MSLLWRFLLCEYCWDFCNRAETAKAWDRQHHSLSLMITININNNIYSNIYRKIISHNNTDREKVNKNHAHLNVVCQQDIARDGEIEYSN